MYVVVVCVLGELSNMRHLSGSKEVTTGIQGGGSVLTGTKKVNDRKGLFLPSENPSLSYFTYICFRIWDLWVLCSYLSDCLSWDDVEYLCVLPLLPFCQWKEERGNLISDPIGFERFLESPPQPLKCQNLWHFLGERIFVLLSVIYICQGLPGLRGKAELL